MVEAIRCKFFDRDGNPIDGGCRYSSRCRFIHPDDRRWEDATPHKGRRNSNSFKDDRPRRFSHSRRASRDSQSYTQYDREGQSTSKGDWGRGYTENRSSDNYWSKTPDVSGGTKNSFDSGPSANSATENQPSVGGWGSTNISGETNISEKESGSGWGWSGKTQNDAGGSGGWGSGSRGENASGWGSGGWGEDASGWETGGWGTSGGGWGEDTNNAAEKSVPKQVAQSIPNSPSVLSTTPAISRLRSYDEPQTAAPQPSLSNKVLSDTVSSNATTIPKPSEEVIVNDTVLPATSSTSPPTGKRTRLPLPTRIKQASVENQPLQPSPLIPLDWTRIPLSGSIPGRTQAEDVASEASTSASVLASLSPTELHSKLVKNIMRAVLIRHGLLEAEERKEKWRHARGSICYQHSTPAAQKILESTNHKLSEEILCLNKQFKASLKEIITFSDALDKRKHLLEQGIDQKQVLGYTDKLRDWVAELDLNTRIDFIKATIKDTREPQRNRKQEEVNGLKSNIFDLDLKITDVSDDLFRLQDELPERFREEYSATEKALEGPGDFPDFRETFAELGLEEAAFEGIKEKIKDVDLKALNHLPKVDELKKQINALEEEVEELRKKDEEIIEFRKQATATLKKMEEWNKDEKARLERILGDIELLHSQPKTHAPSLLPIKVEDLSPYVDKLVAEYVTTEIKPTLDAIAHAIDADTRRFTAEFNRLVEQMVMKTYDLVWMTFKANGFVPQFVPSLP